MNVESIIVKDGDNSSIPTYGVFYGSGCTDSGITRFYEVDNLAQSKCWVDSGNPVIYSDKDTIPMRITKGEWKPITTKFITEYTDKGYLKIIFGAGNGDNADLNGVTFNQWQMSKILNNNNLGVLPKPNTTLYVLYRVGGGSSSNVAKGAINKISYLNADFRKGPNNNADVSQIINSLRVENTTPSVSGKDMPNETEMKYFIKYHNAAQERCVTIKDYIDRLLMLPPKYGTPFRIGVTEENNKIVIYLLGVDSNGKLSDVLPKLLVENIKNYIKEYRMINDYIEIKSGRIINIGFDVDAVIDKNYNKIDVVIALIDTIINYMDINGHVMGEEIYIGDLQKELGKVDGVINIINIQVTNERGPSYGDEISQETIPYDNSNDKFIVDLDATDGILYNESDTMMEIKYAEQDIRIRIKER